MPWSFPCTPLFDSRASWYLSDKIFGLFVRLLTGILEWSPNGSCYAITCSRSTDSTAAFESPRHHSDSMSLNEISEIRQSEREEYRAQGPRRTTLNGYLISVRYAKFVLYKDGSQRKSLQWYSWMLPAEPSISIVNDYYPIFSSWESPNSAGGSIY
jgi:hypothetical protein